MEALVREHDEGPPHAPLTSLYLGGGTPSLLAPHRLQRLLEALHPRSDAAEVTLEANPANVSDENLGAWRDLGINRLSIGIQTFQDSVLASLGRHHDGAEARRALDRVSARWSGTWSADLLVGWAGQTLEHLESDLQEIVSRQPPHISIYGLTIEPGTPLQALQDAGRTVTAPPDRSPAFDDLWSARLGAAGFTRYEVSNFALEGHDSRHNRVYWDNESYLGLGPGASSSVHPWRWTNLRDTRTYIDRVGSPLSVRSSCERLTPSDRLLESLGAGLRTPTGLGREHLTRRFGPGWEAMVVTAGDAMLDSGLLVIDAAGLRLAPGALVRADRVITELAAAWGSPPEL